MRIEIGARLLADLRAMTREGRKEIGTALEEVRNNFGKPHLHHGLGLRDLGHGIYECRLGLHRRLVFSVAKGVLFFHLLGDHDRVRRFLRSQ